MPSDFWDVRSHEQAEEASLQRQMDSLDAAIQLGKRAAAMRSSPGYEAFVRAIGDLRDVATRKLVRGEGLSNDQLREQRSRVVALEDVLAILTRETVVEHLEAQLAVRKNAMAEAMKRRPKPREVNP